MKESVVSDYLLEVEMPPVGRVEPLVGVQEE